MLGGDLHPALQKGHDVIPVPLTNGFSEIIVRPLNPLSGQSGSRGKRRLHWRRIYRNISGRAYHRYRSVARRRGARRWAAVGGQVNRKCHDRSEGGGRSAYGLQQKFGIHEICRSLICVGRAENETLTSLQENFAGYQPQGAAAHRFSAVTVKPHRGQSHILRARRGATMAG